MNIKEKIGKRIRDSRENLSLTREELAKKVKTLSAPRIGNWELGLRTPGPAEVILLARELNVSPAYLYCFTDDQGFHGDGSGLTEMKTLPVLSLENVANFQEQAHDDLYEMLKKHEHLLVDSRTASQLPQNAFAIKLTDTSMSPLFQVNDLIIINPDKQPIPSQYVLAKANDHKPAIFRKYKEISKEMGTKSVFELVPLNSDWPTVKKHRRWDLYYYRKHG